MARNGAGLFSLIYNWQDDDANSIPIQSDRMQGQEQDVADALTASIAKDGQTTPTANLPMGGFKHTGVGAAVSATDYLRADQAQNGSLTYYVASGTDAYTITPIPAVSAYAAGLAFDVKIANTNLTSTPTLNVSGIGLPKATITVGGLTSVAIGALTAGTIFHFEHDGTQWQVLGIPATVMGLADGGTQTTAFTAAANTRYLVDTNGTTAITTTGPASMLAGQIIQLAKFGTGTLTFALNGLNFNGGTVNPVSSDEGISTLEYSGATRGYVEG